MSNWRDFLCGLLSCSTDCEEKLRDCLWVKREYQRQLEEAKEKIRHLELLVPRPPSPELRNTIEKDTVWVQSILMGLGAEIIRLPLGPEFRLVDKDTFIDFIAWDWVDSFEYHKFYRCGNFTVSFKASADQWGVNQVGIVLDYQSSHAYNIVVFPNGKVMLLEPQSDNLFYWQEHAPQFYPLEGAVVVI